MTVRKKYHGSCRMCDEPFRASDPRQKFCGKECNKTYFNGTFFQAYEGMHQSTCLVCRKDFWYGRALPYMRPFCSSACKAKGSSVRAEAQGKPEILPTWKWPVHDLQRRYMKNLEIAQRGKPTGTDVIAAREKWLAEVASLRLQSWNSSA